MATISNRSSTLHGTQIENSVTESLRVFEIGLTLLLSAANKYLGRQVARANIGVASHLKADISTTNRLLQVSGSIDIVKTAKGGRLLVSTQRYLLCFGD